MVDLIQKKYAERITLASSSRASAHVAGRGKESSDIANAYTGTFDSTTCFVNVATRPNVHGRPSYVATPFVMIDQGIQPFAAASGITVNEGSFTTEDELMAKVKAGHPGEYNFFMSASEFACLRFLRLGQGMELETHDAPCRERVREKFDSICGNERETASAVTLELMANGEPAASTLDKVRLA